MSPKYPPLDPPPLFSDPNAPPDRCNDCGTYFFVDKNRLGMCSEEDCYRLGDCNWSPVRELNPLVVFPPVMIKSGGMCFFNNDCSACGSAFSHECNYGECGAIGMDCVYVANSIADEGGICISPSKNECSKCSQIPGGCKEDLCEKISPNCVFTSNPTEQNPEAGTCSIK